MSYCSAMGRGIICLDMFITKTNANYTSVVQTYNYDIAQAQTHSSNRRIVFQNNF
jgi:hypothetical protein